MYIYVLEKFDYRIHDDDIVGLFRKEEDVLEETKKRIKDHMINREEYLHLEIDDNVKDFGETEGILYIYRVVWNDDPDEEYDEEEWSNRILVSYYIRKMEVK